MLNNIFYALLIPDIFFKTHKIKLDYHISILLPTYNCESTILATLESIKWGDEIIVIDSYSTDSTIEIASKFGARVIQHEYINSAKQKNWALQHCIYDWVFQIDSDESLEQDAENIIRAIIKEINKEIKIGEFITHGKGKALTIISYGNGLYHSLKAQPEIEKKINRKIKIIDICWLSDINIDVLLKEIGQCKKVLIVDECRRSGCHGEGLMASLYEKSKNDLDIKLHAAEDSFIPLGIAATSTLPDYETITHHSIELINNE